MVFGHFIGQKAEVDKFLKQPVDVSRRVVDGDVGCVVSYKPLERKASS